MKSLEVSRRRMMALLGASVALAPGIAAASPELSRIPHARGVPGHDIPEEASALIAPLAAGSRLAEWKIERVSVVRHGAVTVALRNGQAKEFFLDICARDNGLGAPVPPGRSDCCDVFVANLGDGARPTEESHGLAAMALAEVLRTNEHRVRVAGLLTLRDRLSRFPDQVLRGF